jgi:Uma2 family endonuclease
MWEGTLHMVPAPSPEHQRIASKTNTFLDVLCERTRRGTIWPAVNVVDDRAATPDYRIPDFSFIAQGNEDLVRKDGIHGAPDAVLEIRSPGDESYEKLDFFARLGVREVIVIDRDSKRPEVFRLAGPRYLAVSADGDGWVASEALRVRFRALPSAPPRLAIGDIEDPGTTTEL